MPWQRTRWSSTASHVRPANASAHMKHVGVALSLRSRVSRVSPRLLLLLLLLRAAPARGVARGPPALRRGASHPSLASPSLLLSASDDSSSSATTPDHPLEDDAAESLPVLPSESLLLS